MRSSLLVLVVIVGALLGACTQARIQQPSVIARLHTPTPFQLPTSTIAPTPTVDPTEGAKVFDDLLGTLMRISDTSGRVHDYMDHPNSDALWEGGLDLSVNMLRIYADALATYEIPNGEGAQLGKQMQTAFDPMIQAAERYRTAMKVGATSAAEKAKAEFIQYDVVLQEVVKQTLEEHSR